MFARFREQRGNAIVDATLLIPLILFAGMGVVHIALTVYMNTVTQAVVDEATRVASQSITPKQTAISYIEDSLRTVIGSTQIIKIEPSFVSVSGIDALTVETEIQMEFLGFLGSRTILVKSTSILEDVI